MVLGKNDPGFIHNGPLAGLVAVCAGSDLMHPIGALVTGLASPAAVRVQLFTITQNRWKIDDVLGVWPLHGLCGAWGGIAAGIFGAKALGGMGGVSLAAQLIGTLGGIVVALAGGLSCLWHAARHHRHPPGRRRRIRRRRPDHPQNHRHTGSGNPLVST
jgi:Amt family ammonium transporter